MPQELIATQNCPGCGANRPSPVALPKHAKPPKFTEVCTAVERFWTFEPSAREKAVACSAAELGVGQIHFYAIAHLLGLEGAA